MTANTNIAASVFIHLSFPCLSVGDCQQEEMAFLPATERPFLPVEDKFGG